MSRIEDLLGEGAIPSPRPSAVEKHLLTTGFMNLDFALGGGIPKGSIVEIVGDTGKTTLALGILAEHPQSLYIDCDHAFDEYYANLIGVSPESLIMKPTDLFAQLEMAITIEIPLIIIDSAAGIVTSEEERAEEFKDAMNCIKNLNKESVIIFTNQFRWNGSRTISSDNYAIKRYADIRILLEAKQRRGDLQLYSIDILHNRFSPPTTLIELAQYLGEGMSKEYNLLETASNWNIICNTSSRFYLDGFKLGHGHLQAIDFLKQNPGVKELIKGRLLKIWDTL